MPDLAMPRLSDSMEEGTILKWLKASGDEVKRGEELVEIETDKANMTYEADADGVLDIVAQEGDTLPVGETIARIGADGGPPEKAESEQAQAKESGPAQEPEVATEEPEEKKEEADGGRAENGTSAETPSVESEPQDGRIKASPVARRVARERGVSLADVKGTGPGGRILKSDVEGLEPPSAPEPKAEPTPAAAPPAEEQKGVKADQVPAAVVSGTSDGSIKGEVTVQELTKLQQTVARRMAESKATAPEFVLNLRVDMEQAVALRKELKEASEGPVPSFNDFVVKAAALALRDFPRANGSYRDGKFELYSRVNVGIAVAGQDALVVPTVFDADRKSVGEIGRESRALAQRVRAAVITPPELSGGTFTVSNLGMFGIRSFTAVINPPQAAILAVGELAPQPVVRKEKVKIRHQMELTLSCDHRILYGADAAEFFARIRELLENPLSLAL